MVHGHEQVSPGLRARIAATEISYRRLLVVGLARALHGHLHRTHHQQQPRTRV